MGASHINSIYLSIYGCSSTLLATMMLAPYSWSWFSSSMVFPRSPRYVTSVTASQTAELTVARQKSRESDFHRSLARRTRCMEMSAIRLPCLGKWKQHLGEDACVPHCWNINALIYNHVCECIRTTGDLFVFFLLNAECLIYFHFSEFLQHCSFNSAPS